MVEFVVAWCRFHAAPCSSPDPDFIEDAMPPASAGFTVGQTHGMLLRPDNEIVVTVDGHRLVIQVLNRETRQVVEQISPRSIFRMFKGLAGV